MYEHKEVWEPTGPGEWWRRSSQYPNLVIVTVFQPRRDKLMWTWLGGECHSICREEGVTWTGPIPVPGEEPAEDKPPVSDEELGHVALRAVEQIYGHSQDLCTPGFFQRLGAIVRAKLAGRAPEIIDEEPQTISLAPGASVTFNVDGVRKFVVKADELVLRVDDEQISAEDALRVQAKMQDTARGRPVSDEEGGLRVVLKILVDADKEVHAWVDSAGFIRTEPWSK